MTKAQAGNTADHAAVKADEANAELAQKKEEAKVQASVAGVRKFTTGSKRFPIKQALANPSNVVIDQIIETSSSFH